jgi:phosphatidyl-myo-inositol dimannoside synthase
MLKTLVITHEYYPYRGGVGRYCYNLFRNFDPKDYVVLTDQEEIDFKLARAEIFVTNRIKPSWLIGLYHVAGQIRRQSAQIIFTPHILPLGAIAYVLYRLQKIPYVISLHGLDINLAMKRRRRLALAILGSAKCIVVNSQATKRAVDRINITTPVKVITPNIESELLMVDGALHDRLSEKYRGKKIILTVGRLVRRKGQDMIIMALPRILRSVPSAHYLIVGTGPDYSYLLKLIKANRVADNVTILNNISDEELGTYFKLATLFAMPTRVRGASVEGFGIVYLQAAYFSLPIIAGSSGGEAEAVNNGLGGLCVDGTNLSIIAKSIIKVLKDEKMAKRLGRGAKYHFDQMPANSMQAEKLKKILS